MAVELPDDILSGKALEREIKHALLKKEELSSRGNVLQAALMHVVIDLLEVQKHLPLDSFGTLSEAHASLETCRQRVLDCARPGGDPERQRKALLEIQPPQLKQLLNELGSSQRDASEAQVIDRLIADFAGGEAAVECGYPPEAWHAPQAWRWKSREELAALPASQLKQWVLQLGKLEITCITKEDFVDLLFKAQVRQTDADSAGAPRPHRIPLAECTNSQLREPPSYLFSGWQGQQLQELAQSHAALPPKDRRAHSWARTLAYALLRLAGRSRRSNPKPRSASPFVVWVFLASDAVEGELAEAGFFEHANYFDQAPLQIKLFGVQNLRSFPDGTATKNPSSVQAGVYEDLCNVSRCCLPDCIVAFMPQEDIDALPGLCGSDCWKSLRQVLQLQAVPAVVTLRKRPSEQALQELYRVGGNKKLLLPPTRSPFSAVPQADGKTMHDDNGWLLAASGLDGLQNILVWLGMQRQQPMQSPVDVSGLQPPCADEAQEQRNLSLPAAIFWGIVDLKYDPSRPVLERVKVLETGDGRISKFSRDGACIPKLAYERYRIKPGQGPQKFTVISTDKRLTHDLMEQAGYSYIVPRQACFLRKFDEGLAQRIREQLGIEEAGDDIVVLKLCNRSRGAGVLMVRSDSLEEMLRSVLVPPDDMEAWFRQRLDGMAQRPSDLGLGSEAEMQEQLRHWWSNECPSFVAERFYCSAPIIRDEMAFDATMRVSFVLHHRQGLCEPPGKRTFFRPEELEVGWVGGYWKLPRGDATCGDLRHRFVSAARASGTAPVELEHLQEVYATLGDAMRQLFGGPEPDPQQLSERYRDKPEVQAYILARLAMSSLKEPEKVNAKLQHAEEIAAQATDGAGKRCVESCLSRSRGVSIIRTGGEHWAAATEDQWRRAEICFRRAVDLLPTSANSFFCLGMACLENGRLQEALAFMNKSLLLDPDFKGPYVNLGIVYIRLGQYGKAIEISNNGLARYPQNPQCSYHLGVATYQQAVHDFERYAESRLSGHDAQLKLALEVSAAMLHIARKSEEARRRLSGRNLKSESPWLDADEEMAQEAEAVAAGKLVAPRAVEIPPYIGWRFMNWRT